MAISTGFEGAAANGILPAGNGPISNSSDKTGKQSNGCNLKWTEESELSFKDFTSSAMLSEQIGQSFTDEFFDATGDSMSEHSSDDEGSRHHQFLGKSPSQNYMYRLKEEYLRRITAEEALAHEKQKHSELIACLQSVAKLFPKGFDFQSGHVLLNGQDNLLATPVETQGGKELEGRKPFRGGITYLLNSEKHEDASVKVVEDSPEITSIESSGNLEGLLSQKEKELSRLKDKMAFLERMNEELSNQTQETMENHRMNRKRQQTVQKFGFAGLGLVLGIGISVATVYVWSWGGGSANVESGGNSNSGVSD